MGPSSAKIRTAYGSVQHVADGAVTGSPQNVCKSFASKIPVEDSIEYLRSNSFIEYCE